MSEKEKTKKKENVHKDHRSRMHERFLNTGFEHFEPHQVLEYLLFFPIPRRDTNPTAHRLLNAFKGDFDRVLRAKPGALMKVEGVGERTAGFFSLLGIIDRKYRGGGEKDGAELKNRREVLERLIPFLRGEPDGTVCVMFFNNSVEPLDTVRYDGKRFGYPTPDYRLIVKDAMDRNAGSLATARKCGGRISFSAKERAAFRELDHLLRRLDMCLIDHFAVTDTDGEACFGQNALDLAFFTEA